MSTPTSTVPQYIFQQLSSLRHQSMLVTGGCGFVGTHLVQLLLDCQCKVTVFDVIQPRKPIQHANVAYIAGDLLSLKDLLPHVTGMHTVFHVASPSPVSNNAELFFRVNVDGTKNVIEACRLGGVPRLVYTSSASVIFDGTNQKNLDEATPIPERTLDAYTRSKFRGEQCILNANGTPLANAPLDSPASKKSSANQAQKLLTCSLRPHGIFGPNDPNFIPKLAELGAQGKDKYRIGDGTNLVDFTYILNVVYAHALAAVKLHEGSPVCGNAYFITNSQPVLFWDFFNTIFRFFGYAGGRLTFPLNIMRPVAKGLGYVKKIVPSLPVPASFTLQAVNYAGLHHYYSCEKAGKDMGYFPPTSLEEGLRITLNSFEHLKSKNPLPPPELKPSVSQRSPIATLIFILCSLVLLLSVLWNPVQSFLSTSTWWTVMILWLHVLLIIRFIYHQTSFGERVIDFSEMPDLSGSWAIVTGANRGIGYHTALGLAKRNCNVVIACRDEAKGNAAVKTIQATSGTKANICFLPLDLSSLQAVRTFVTRLSSVTPQVNYIVHNAGAITEKKRSVDGFDLQVQANYLSHFYLTQLLRTKNLLTDSARIVYVSSVMHFVGHINFDDFHSEKSYNRAVQYNICKLMQIAHMFKLQRDLDAEMYSKLSSTPVPQRKTTIAVNPGAVATEFHDHYMGSVLRKICHPIMNTFLTKSPEQGAASVLYATLSKDMKNVGGVYVDNCHITIASAEARDEKVQNRLWDISTQLCCLEAK